MFCLWRTRSRFCGRIFRQYLYCLGGFSQQSSNLDGGRISGNHPYKVIFENCRHSAIMLQFRLFLRLRDSEIRFYLSVQEKTRQTPGYRPSGFLTGYCGVSCYPIDLAFVPFIITTSKLRVIMFSKLSLQRFIYFQTLFQKDFAPFLLRNLSQITQYLIILHTFVQ